MESAGTLFLLRLIHIVLGMFWVGAVVFLTVFLLPSIRAIGPSGGAIMEQLSVVRKLPVFMMAAAALTVLSGIGLYWRDSAGFTSAWMHSGQGMMFGTGGVLGILGAAVGMSVTSPQGKRMAELAAQMRSAGAPPRPDLLAAMQKLQAAIARSTSVVVVLLVLAVCAMAVARYVP
jgi:uncharacterized membrane protein